MGESKLGTKVREAIKAVFLRRKERQKKMASARNFRPVPAKVRLSTRGQYAEPWRTKKWTPSRKRSRQEDLTARRKQAAAASEAEGREAYVERMAAKGHAVIQGREP